MDSTQAAQIDTVKEESLLETKARFLNQAKQVDILAPLRNHPWSTVSSAAVLGAVAGVATSAFASPQVVVYQNEKQKESHEAKKPIGTVAALLTALRPLLLKVGHSAASAWLAKRQAAATYETPVRHEESYE